MQIISQISQLRSAIINAKSQGLKIGFVPTMGFLHAGHQQLIQTARSQCDIVAVSIFVNPLQFGPNEDFASYPRNLEQDMKICGECQVDILFTPTKAELIGQEPPLTQVQVANLGRYLCGASRPGHFNGVCTIVTKLFNIVQPDLVYMGQKDIQQLRVIQKMVAELNFPVEVIGVSTVRAEDGLALSSRNSYLNQEERQAALLVPQVLALVQDKIREGYHTRSKILELAAKLIAVQPLAKLDYLQIVDYENLQLTDDLQQSLIVAIAIFIGKTRLIDNCIIL